MGALMGLTGNLITKTHIVGVSTAHGCISKTHFVGVASKLIKPRTTLRHRTTPNNEGGCQSVTFAPHGMTQRFEVTDVASLRRRTPVPRPAVSGAAAAADAAAAAPCR